MHHVLDLGVERIGHGIITAFDPDLLARVAETGTVLELCPTSNVRTGAVRDVEQMGEIVQRLCEAGVRIVVATDGPEMIGTRLRAEYALLVRLGAITAVQAREINQAAHEATFLPGVAPATSPLRVSRAR
jgi:adenosine deaminase